ncbi:DUF302 domain-containing protein [Isachenkonia alkalipeptolytica]|uniref:DUF302 domain-containing protein n=1 Tax=Isachenkonia alkalipeptolytica TaxID=2565777 RepID=A0AA43XJC8_9CLOT|nr:DUF302 domain-containing protein [Isachenkonia alkalipeptolytica]NBG87812.1 DUF302 domain-containing protein [Isachenkonia alkalipeptolytica]
MSKKQRNQTIIFIVIALVAGGLLTGFTLYQSAPNAMMMEDESPYGFEETVERFKDEVEAAGWSVAGMHDMQEILDGHGFEVDRIEIYELCSSQYSAMILEEDDERIVSPLMPCRISIYEKSDGNTYISRMNSKLMARPFGGIINEVMQQAADETEEILDKVLE